MTTTVIIQRVIPNYRLFLFRELFSQYGIKTISSGNVEPLDYLNLPDVRDEPFFVHANIKFPIRQRPGLAVGFVGPLLRELGAKNVVAEFGLQQSWVYELILLRKIGYINRLAFFSHGWQMERGFSRRQDRLVQELRGRLYKKADLIINYTEEGHSWSSKFVGAKSSWVENTIRVETQELRVSPTPKGPMMNILSIGRMTPDKMMDKLVDLAEIISESGVPCRVTIIGDGPDANKLRRKAEKSEVPVVLLGQTYDERHLAEIFRESHATVILGSAGLLVNHSLAYGVPVFAYSRRVFQNHHPEIAYVVPGETGQLVESPTLEAMANALISAFKSGELDRLSESAQKFYRRKLSPETVVKNWASVLEAYGFLRRTPEE